MHESEEILDFMRRTGALLDGHFLLTSGRHSDRYFQCALLLQHPEIADRLTDLLADRFRSSDVQTVIAPAVGGILVAQGVARALGCRAIFAEREAGRMTLRRGFTLEPGERTLVVEDVVTTGGSVREVVELVREKGAEVIGVGMLVDRSQGKVGFEEPAASLLQMDAPAWDAGSCPLWKKGGAAVKPGSRGLG